MGIRQAENGMISARRTNEPALAFLLSLIFSFSSCCFCLADINVDELLRYSHMISTTFATDPPPMWVPEDPRRPYPREGDIANGRLAALAHLSTAKPQAPPDA